MTKPKRSAIITKISKLKAMAEGAKQIGNQEEAAAFAGKVSKLLLQYKLTLSDVELLDSDEDSIDREYVGGDKTAAGYKRKRSAWQERLANAIAKAHFCRIFIISGTNNITFVGRQSDREIAIWVYVYLVGEIVRLSQGEYDRFYYLCEKECRIADARGFKASYTAAFVNVVTNRYYEERKAFEEHGGKKVSKALVVCDEAVQSYCDNLSAGSADNIGGMTSFNEAGYKAGKKGGKEARIHGNHPIKGSVSSQPLLDK